MKVTESVQKQDSSYSETLDSEMVDQIVLNKEMQVSLTGLAQLKQAFITDNIQSQENLVVDNTKSDVKASSIQTEEVDVDNTTVQTDQSEMRINTDVKGFLLYLFGFVLGISFSLFGAAFLKFIDRVQKKRKGLYIGFIISFIVMLSLCMFYISYSRDVEISKNEWLQYHKNLHHLKTPEFSDYVKYYLKKYGKTLANTASVMKMEKSQNKFDQGRRNKLKMRSDRTIRTLRRVQHRIRRQLRVLL